MSGAYFLQGENIGFFRALLLYPHYFISLDKSTSWLLETLLKLENCFSILQGFYLNLLLIHLLMKVQKRFLLNDFWYDFINKSMF